MPSEAQSLSALITAIYDAALDQTLWRGTLEQICAFVRGPAAMFRRGEPLALMPFTFVR